jgi:outer membrane immunogenic protein
MRFLAATALLLAATATPAFAQADQAPAPFTGGHVEAVSGLDHVGAFGDGDSGVVYGGAIGYDLQRGHVVFGAEGEVTGSSVEDSGVRAGRDLYAGGRVGFVVGDSTLIYGKGGYTNARVTFGGAGANFDGYRVGGGVEHDFGRFYGKVEYRYSRYDDAELNRDQVVAGVGIRF